MAEHDELLADIRARLEQARAVYKSFYDKHHRNVRYAVGDGYSFAFDIVPQRPYMWSPRGSFGPISTGHTESLLSSTTSPTASNFLPAPGCMTSSTSGS
jgi:hypothetical protein